LINFATKGIQNILYDNDRPHKVVWLNVSFIAMDSGIWSRISSPKISLSKVKGRTARIKAVTKPITHPHFGRFSFKPLSMSHSDETAGVDKQVNIPYFTINRWRLCEKINDGLC